MAKRPFMRAPEMRKFIKLAKKHLAELGAVPGTDADGMFHDYVRLETPVGRLWLRVEDKPFLMATVFSRFDEPRRAQAAGIDCNRYSGKWNHHYGTGWDAEAALAHFAGSLRGVMAKESVVVCQGSVTNASD